MDTYKINFHKPRVLAQGYMPYYTREAVKPTNLIKQKVSAELFPRPSQYLPATNVAEVEDSVRICTDYHGCFILEDDVPAVLRSINKSKFSNVVRKSLQRENFLIQGWQARNLDGKSKDPASLGVYRFEGVGVDRNDWLDWAVILKVVQSPANLGLNNDDDTDDTTAWNYWKRELLVYQSGWLATLPEGILAPRCYDAVEIPGNIAGIWLEDVKDSYLDTWPLHRYALAARHLGRLNGIFISRRPLPTFPWLSKHLNRQWLGSFDWRNFNWDHPKVWQHYPNPEIDSFRSLLQENERFIDMLEKIPRTICHGNTDPANFKSCHSPRKPDQTVMLNWGQAGIEPLGYDLGQLVYGTYMNLRSYKLQDISEILFTSYVNGLQDSGCRVDTQLVRFGYTASAAFRVGLAKLMNLGEQIKRGDGYIPHTSYNPMISEPFESVMADEAYRLLDKI